MTITFTIPATFTMTVDAKNLEKARKKVIKIMDKIADKAVSIGCVCTIDQIDLKAG